MSLRLLHPSPGAGLGLPRWATPPNLRRCLGLQAVKPVQAGAETGLTASLTLNSIDFPIGDFPPPFPMLFLSPQQFQK